MSPAGDGRRTGRSRRRGRRPGLRFFAWCDDRGLTLTTIRPFDVATYIETLGKTHSAPGVKQQLAAVRMLFDCERHGGTTYYFCG